MNCREFERTIIDFGYEHLMEVPEAAPALAHTETCARCAARLHREQRMTAGLQALALRESSINAPERVRSALRAAFDGQHAAAASPMISRKPVRFFFAGNRALWGLAAAAMLLLLSITAVLWLREQRSKVPNAPPGSTDPFISQHPPVKPPAVKPPEVSPNGQQDSGIHSPPSSAEHSTGKRTHRRALPVEMRVDGEPKLFPLTFVATSGPAEFVQTVRVEISRRTLLSMGLPINVDRGEGWLKADLIIGEDGVARAVRIFN